MTQSAQIIIPAYQPNTVLFDIIESLTTLADKQQAIQLNIILVNDGSTTSEATKLFSKISETFKNVVLINHEKNEGKGHALKTALRYIKENFNSSSWVVTADADGQHLPSDIWALVKAGGSNSDPVIGARRFDNDVPFRSKLGNTLTQFLFNFIYKKKLSDTQSGLRGFHCKEIPSLLSFNSKRYAFELEALVHFAKNSKLREIPITTVYEPGNPTSHFNPLLDSLAIYAVLFRQVLSGMFAMVLEIIMFLSLSYVGVVTAIALPIARLFSGTAFFLLSRNFVFYSNGKLPFQAFQYVILVGLNLAISVNIINFFVNNLELNKLIGLFTSYIFLFIINFLIQKYFIFIRY